MTDTYELPPPTAWVFGPARAGLVLTEHKPGSAGLMTALFTADQVRAAILAERERAAKVAEDMPITYERDGHYYNTVPEDYAAAIRKG